jgi:hypothetical protein
MVNAASRGRGGLPARGDPNRGWERGHERGSYNKEDYNRVECQLCGKKGHTMMKCFKRFDQNYTGEEKSAVATTSYDIDNSWYADSGITDHITGDLEKLSTRDKYLGNDQVHTANGSGLKIDQVDHYVIHAPTHYLSLNNVLYVPDSSINLVSVHCFTLDNNIFLELHPWYFFIKDRASRRVLHHCKIERGLYPLKSLQKQVCAITKPSKERWHSQLVHPSLPFVQRVLGQNKLPVSKESCESVVCDACQQGKTHQLAYPKSLSVSKLPLELVFSVVLGPATESVGRKKYYVSFIDDFSKFVWIYTLKHKSEVFEHFYEFQNLVERLFDQKILSIQMDWGW